MLDDDVTDIKCVCVFVCARRVRYPLCFPSFYTSPAWLDLWPGHWTFPVLTAHRSSSCKTERVCVCVNPSVLWLHPGANTVCLPQLRDFLFTPFFLHLICTVEYSIFSSTAFLPRFPAPSAEETRNCTLAWPACVASRDKKRNFATTSSYCRPSVMLGNRK